MAEIDRNAELIPEHMRAGYRAGCRMALDHLEAMAAASRDMTEPERVAFWRYYLCRVLAPLYMLADVKGAEYVIASAMEEAERHGAGATRKGSLHA